MLVPLGLAAASPLLQWRQPVYIAAGFAGIFGMALMVVQPMLSAGLLPGIGMPQQRNWHRVCGIFLIIAIAVHVAGLWITSPPDVIDVFLVRSPTPFAIWGLLAFWAVLAAAGLAALRRRLPLRFWRWGHSALVSLTVIGTVLHAVQIDGTMEDISKWVLSLAVLAALAMAIYRRRVWVMGLRRRA
ncbi:MAG: ferric reductase-like transmembrane domain-containing protein [Pseudomonadota bacterium]